ncbi:hypothetical protein [Methanocella conradii]|uniref:hypothetical protein n=1 Tax=Methanocella conradii TaxID=1175444 RepID=UPI00157C4C22|nr:hypothetical protein [Methanocella conradii]
MKYKLNKIIIIGIIIGIIIQIISLLFIINFNNISNILSNNSSIIDDDVNLNVNSTPTVSFTPNDSLTFPSNDFAINNINWSSYPNLQTGYVYTVYIAGPNNVIPYKFIEVQICTEVKNTENRTIIEEQLAGVAREAKKIYGPPSSISIIGTKGGAAAWIVSLLPYEDTSY